MAHNIWRRLLLILVIKYLKLLNLNLNDLWDKSFIFNRPNKYIEDGILLLRYGERSHNSFRFVAQDTGGSNEV
jgi:hypothetical protein